MADVIAHPGPGTPTDRAKAVAQHAATQHGAAIDPSVGHPAVVLIGPPGSGKSSVGAAIARSTGLLFRDTDTDIERRAGRSIPDIFLTDGEPHFRDLERAAVLEALAEHTGVLALGGGAILAGETRARLLGHSVVFLNLSMPVGIKRTGLAVNRPLLAGVNPRATYRALLEARLGHYRETARFEVQTDDLSVADVARTIIEKLELQ
jgi:shikimate kinase